MSKQTKVRPCFTFISVLTWGMDEITFLNLKVLNDVLGFLLEVTQKFRVVKDTVPRLDWEMAIQTMLRPV